MKSIEKFILIMGCYFALVFSTLLVYQTVNYPLDLEVVEISVGVPGSFIISNVTFTKPLVLIVDNYEFITISDCTFDMANYEGDEHALTIDTPEGYSNLLYEDDYSEYFKDGKKDI